jgi:hypothetical protein
MVYDTERNMYISIHDFENNVVVEDSTKFYDKNLENTPEF